MSVLEELEETLYKTFKDVITALAAFTASVEEEYAFFDCVGKDIENYKKEGILTCSFQNDTAASKRPSSLKENVETNERNSKRQTRQNVLEKTNILSNLSNLVENHVDKSVTDAPIKIERTSKSIANIVMVKQEGDMLPPQNTRVPKGRPIQVKVECIDDSIVEPNNSVDVVPMKDSSKIRVTRARTKGRVKAEVVGRVDDSIAEPNNSVSVVVVEDLSKIRVTRARTKGRANAEVNNVDLDVKVKPEKTRTKSRKKKENSQSSENVIIDEDKNADGLSQKQNAVTMINENGVETTIQAVNLVEQKAEHAANAASNENDKAPCNIDDIMTDDDSPQGKSHPRKVTQFFTPHASTPVSKCGTKLNGTKVETLGGHRLPSDLTRNPKLQNSSLRDSKLKFLQTSATRASAARAKTSSALKASQIEFREREMRRKQKEEEALRKKQALILAQTEGRRLRREEREMKVQQMKMDMEKEKQRQLMEAEKAREEKFKQILADKEAKFFKQKEEAVRKRAAAAQKIDNKLEDTSKLTPIFLICQAPLLPTPDCYDSDDSTTRGTFVIPQFQKKDNLNKRLCQMQTLNSCGQLLFGRSLETPNLLKIFPGIKASQLKRTSSAIWNKTEMSIIESFFEE